jgi:membrane-associated phospholipid phosphatase
MWCVPLFSVLAFVILLVTSSNRAVFEFLNHHMAETGNLWWANLTLLGDTAIALMFILPLLGRRPNLVWQFFLAALFATFWAQGVKALVASMRPPAVMPAGSFHLIGPLLEQHSFPSGHTTTIFILAGLICLQYLDNWIKYSVLLLAVLVGLSRIACGVHWPLDVLGGMFGGWLSAVAGIWLSTRWQGGLNIWFQRVLALILTLTAIWSIFYYYNGIPGTRLLQITITVICLAMSIKGQYRLYKTPE